MFTAEWGKYFKVGFEFFSFGKRNLENLQALLIEHEFVHQGHELKWHPLALPWRLLL